MRDLETIALALTSAETGHLVLAALRTKGVDRIVDAFPPAQQRQVRVQLAAALQGVVSRLLVPARDRKGRVPAPEIVVASVAIPSQIREAEAHRMASPIRTGNGPGQAGHGAGPAHPGRAGPD